MSRRGKRYLSAFVNDIGHSEMGISEKDADGETIRRRLYRPTSASMHRLTRLLNHAQFETRRLFPLLESSRPVFTSVRTSGWDAVVEDRIHLDEWGRRLFDVG